MTTDPAGRVVLKPCPFCGSEPYEDAPLDAPGLVHIGCFDCGIDFNAVSTEEAITAWNTRAADAEIERLRAEIADLKMDVIAFCAPWAVSHAQASGLPDGHLHPTHYDILEKAGARMDDFVRATLVPASTEPK